MTDDTTNSSNRRRGNDLSGVGLQEDRPLDGRRVLVAEDNVILSMHVAEVLEGAGAKVVGPFPFADDALAALDGIRPDAAVLDHELMGGTSSRIADRLGSLGVPFAYFTSHTREELGTDVGDAPVLPKPNDAQTLLNAVTTLLR